LGVLSEPGIWLMTSVCVDIMCALLYCEACEIDVAPMAMAAPGRPQSMID